MKIANRDAHVCVNVKKPFDANNLFAQYVGHLYVVYSYRTSWPMFAFNAAVGQWYTHSQKYSVTTSKHRSQAHPSDRNHIHTFDSVQDLIAYIEDHK